jgi:hypothetical protein
MVKIGGVYEFRTKFPKVLGDKYMGMTLVAMGLARRSEYIRLINVLDIRQMYDTLVTQYGKVLDTIDNEKITKLLESCKIYTFETTNGGTSIMLDDWIVSDSIRETNKIDYSISINDVVESDKLKINSLLNGAGFFNITILENR